MPVSRVSPFQTAAHHSWDSRLTLTLRSPHLRTLWNLEERKIVSVLRLIHRRIIANSSAIHRDLMYWVIHEGGERSELTRARRYRGQPCHRTRDHDHDAF